MSNKSDRSWVLDTPGLSLLASQGELTVEQQAVQLESWWDYIRTSKYFKQQGSMPTFSAFVKEPYSTVGDKVGGLIITPETDVAPVGVRQWSQEWGFFVKANEKNNALYGKVEYTTVGYTENVVIGALPKMALYYVGFLHRGPSALYRVSVPRRDGVEACSQPITAHLTVAHESSMINLLTNTGAFGGPMISYQTVLNQLFRWVLAREKAVEEDYRSLEDLGNSCSLMQAALARRNQERLIVSS